MQRGRAFCFDHVYVLPCGRRQCRYWRGLEDATTVVKRASTAFIAPHGNPVKRSETGHPTIEIFRTLECLGLWEQFYYGPVCGICFFLYYFIAWDLLSSFWMVFGRLFLLLHFLSFYLLFLSFSSFCCFLFCVELFLFTPFLCCLQFSVWPSLVVKPSPSNSPGPGPRDFYNIVAWNYVIPWKPVVSGLTACCLHLWRK